MLKKLIPKSQACTARRQFELIYILYFFLLLHTSCWLVFTTQIVKHIFSVGKVKVVCGVLFCDSVCSAEAT